MKIKERPEDFQVEELTDLRPEDSGPFALYRLEKRNLNTLDALHFVRRRWKIDGQRISFGGLKDRHAQTIQYFTIFHGPERQLNQTGLHVEYLGRTAEPFTSKNIRANRFRITIHNLSQEDIQHAQQVVEEVRRDGVPNYFDEQRFGSVSEGEFVARHLVHGRYEEALRLALTAPYEFDRRDRKQEKVYLRTHWGDWKKCLDQSRERQRPESQIQSRERQRPVNQAQYVIAHLVHNSADFRGALAFIDPEQRHLYLNAYQSYLWNRMLARWVEQHLGADQLFTPRLQVSAPTLNRKRTREWPFYHRLNNQQRVDLSSLRLPLPTARAKLDAADPRMILIQEVLKEEGLELRDLKVKGLREWFFSKGDRPALCLPEGITSEISVDERNAEKQKMLLTFDLPRGSYATLVLARLQIGHIHVPAQS
jgi:tRNA pseudouridine13 synthase